MKILYCVGSLDKPGGTEKVLSNKCNYFVNEFGYEIHIITVNQLDKPYCYQWDEKIHFHDVKYISDSNKLKSILNIPNKISVFKNIYRDLIEKIKPDVIIVPERGYLDYVIPFICKEIPKIREFHSSKKAIKIHASQMPFFKRIKHQIMYSVIYNFFNKYDYLILLTSSDAADSKYKTKVRVIPNMIEGSEQGFSPLIKCNAISVGSMNGKIKGFDEQINIWRQIVDKHPNWILNIYGNGGRKAILQNLIVELGLEDNVLLHGNSSALPEKFTDSSIFLFTSVGEGFPMVLIEAMSSGLPCISFNCPHGPSEIITDGQDGYLIDPGDSNTFVEKVTLLIENQQLRQTFGKNAKKNIERLHPANVALKWQSLFQEIIQTHEN